MGSLTEIHRQKETNGIILAASGLRKLYGNPSTAKWPPIPLKGFKNIILETNHFTLINEYIHYIKTYGYNKSTLIAQSNRVCSEINGNIRSVLFNNPSGVVIVDLLMVVQNNYIVPLVNGDLVKVVAIGTSEYRASIRFINVTVESLDSGVQHETLLIRITSYNVCYTKLLRNSSSIVSKFVSGDAK